MRVDIELIVSAALETISCNYLSSRKNVQTKSMKAYVGLYDTKLRLTNYVILKELTRSSSTVDGDSFISAFVKHLEQINTFSKKKRLICHMTSSKSMRHTST